MPLTAKGEEITSALTKEYGAEKGEQVLYAGKNKGTFSGIDSTKLDRLADGVANLAARFDAMVDARGDTVDLTNYSTAQLKKSLAEEWSKLTSKEKRDITSEIEKRGSKEYGAKHK
jgi:hypothetical protein